MVSKEALLHIVKTVAQQKIEKENVSSTEDLLGMCYGNTYLLSLELDKKGINNEGIGVGVKRKYPDDSKPHNLENAEVVFDAQHYLVKVEDEYYCELSSEVKGDQYGQPVVWEELPDEYEIFDDSHTFIDLDPQKRTRREN